MNKKIIGAIYTFTPLGVYKKEHIFEEHPFVYFSRGKITQQEIDSRKEKAKEEGRI